MLTFQVGNYQVGNGLRSHDSLRMKASERIIDWTERLYLFIHFVCFPIGEKYLFKKIQRILSCYPLLANHQSKQVITLILQTALIPKDC